MPRPINPVPTYRHHKPSGQAYTRVTRDGRRRDVYLGPYGSPESKAEFARVCRQVAASAAAAAKLAAGAARLTVNEVAVAFLRQAPSYYRRPDGTPTGEVKEYGYACRHLCEQLGGEPADEVTPGRLKRVRGAMVAAGWCRTRVNRQVRRVRQVFVWAAEEDLVPAAVANGLKVVRGLRKDRSPARESAPVPPAPPADVARAMLHMTPTLRAMVGLQRVTGMRPGEVREMTPAEVDTSDAVWLYRPGSARPGGHKTDHLGAAREIWLGPKAVELLRP